MSLALIPILGIAFFGWFWFSLKSSRQLECQRRLQCPRHHPRGVDRALGLHGIESAAVSAGVIENPSATFPRPR